VKFKKPQCKVCKANLIIPFADLGIAPIANELIVPEKFNDGETYYPLNVMVCGECFLAQLTYSHPSDSIFTNLYPYFSSYSQSWLAHAKEYAEMVIEKYGLDEGSLVVEIASNDGYLLKNFKKKNINVLGVEPCKNVADNAIKNHKIPTVVSFFNENIADGLTKKYGKANLMIANNVLAHVPDMLGFLKGFTKLLKSDGIITFEFPHLLSLIKKNQFDTIYHEHYSYLSLVGIETAFKKSNLKIFDAQKILTHGGSLRIYACHRNSRFFKTNRLVKIFQEEISFGLKEADTYIGYQNKIIGVKLKLLIFLIDLKLKKKKIVAYGAAAKGATLLNYCGIDSDLIEYIVDISPHKQNKYMPGSRIPIKDPKEILITKPDYVLILPWNISEEIIAQNLAIRKWGGKFIVPNPGLKVI